MFSNRLIDAKKKEKITKLVLSDNNKHEAELWTDIISTGMYMGHKKTIKNNTRLAPIFPAN